MKRMYSVTSLSFITGAMLFTQGAFANDCSRPAIMSRTVWNAKPAKASLMKLHKPNSIVIHHTAIRQRKASSLRRKMINLQSFSQRTGRVGKRVKPAWGDIPYHFYVDATGRVAEGRSLKYAGDTNTRYSLAGKIQIVLEGNFDIEKPSVQQEITLKKVLCWLSKEYKISLSSIKGHKQHARTGCPGKNLEKKLPEIIKWLSSK